MTDENPPSDPKIVNLADHKKRSSSSPPPPPPHQGQDSEGLAYGYWRKDGKIWMTYGSKKAPRSRLLCSDMKAIQAESSPDGLNWAITVEVVDPRGARKEVCFTRADAETKAGECMRVLTDAGLVVFCDEEKRHRYILNAVVRAEIPLAYGIVKAGWVKIDDRYVFALPPPIGVIEPDESTTQGSRVVWRGGAQYGRVRQGGTREGWMSEVAARAAKVPLAAAGIGLMLSGPAIPYFPEECESNLMGHFVGESGCGKTTAVRAGASVYGKGAQTTDPGSYLESYKTTINAVENILLAHNHLGICFDELKNIDPRAAATFAYDFATGRRKGRMLHDTSSRPTDSWALPGLSSGEITLADRANEHAFRQQTMDSGADVRVLNITADGAFDAVGSFADRKRFAEELGAASSTHYGWVGPEFVRFLLDHGRQAREEIKKNLGVWQAVSAPLLGENPSLQASRVASRLGPHAASAARAAEALSFPWHDDLAKFGVRASSAASAMFLFFARVLDNWTKCNGVEHSTQTSAIFQLLHDHYHGAPSGAFVPCGAGPNDFIPDETPLAQTVAMRGWKAMTNIRVRSSGIDAPRFAGGDLVYVDVVPAVLEKHLGQSGRAIRHALSDLRKSGFLITEKSDSLRTQRRVDGRHTAVIRIKGEFFE
jgi:hypothetical protein